MTEQNQDGPNGPSGQKHGEPYEKGRPAPTGIDGGQVEKGQPPRVGVDAPEGGEDEQSSSPQKGPR